MLACGAAPVSAELTDQLTKVLPNALIGQGYGVSHLSYPLFLFTYAIIRRDDRDIDNDHNVPT